MSATGRLLAFALALVASLALGLALGTLVGPSPAEDDPPRHRGGHSMVHMSRAEVASP